MDILTAIVILVVAAAIIVVIVGAIIVGCGDACSSSSSSKSGSSSANRNDLPVCTNVTNKWDGNDLTGVSITLKDSDKYMLTAPSVKSTGSCWLDDSSIPVSLSDEGTGHNWTFTDTGLLSADNTESFEANGLSGMNGKFYMTYSTAKDDVIEDMYKFGALKGKAFAATTTILSPDESVGCNVPVCVFTDEKTDHICTTIDGETFYLTSNDKSGHVFWYSNSKDFSFAKFQRWNIHVYPKDPEIIAKKIEDRTVHIGRTKSEAYLRSRGSSLSNKSKSEYCVSVEE